LGCGHRFCEGCWGNWVRAEFEKGPTCIMTKCPEFKCKTRVPDTVQLRFLERKNHGKYHEYCNSNFVTNSRTLKWCPTPNCGCAAELTDTNLLTVSEYEAKNKSTGGVGVVCRCGGSWCWRCARDDHRPSSCEECEEWNNKNSSESENVLWIMANTKICPRCKVHIEKNQGCNHMTCRNCHHEFCWLCKGNWAGHSACGIYDTQLKKEEVEAADAKTTLDKYMHYFTRFDNHHKSSNFAEKTRVETEQKMTKLQSLKGSGAQAVQFLMDSVKAVIRCRRTLQWTYVYAYYLRFPRHDRRRELFETQQQRLEQLTEKLHGLSEKPPETLIANRMRTDMISLTRLVEKYRNNVTNAVSAARSPAS